MVRQKVGRKEGEKYVLKTIVISVPISRIGQLSVKLKRNLAQKKNLLTFFSWKMLCF